MAFGPIISSLVKNAIKASVSFESGIDPLLSRLKTSCPSKEELQKIILTKNSLTQALNQTQTSLKTLTQTSSTLNIINSSLNAATSTIKNLPIPSSVPPGAGVPLGVILTFSSTLDSLSNIINQNQGAVNSVTPSVIIIRKSITNIQSKLNELNILLLSCLNEQSQNLSDEEKEKYFESLNINLDSEIDSINEDSVTKVSLNESLNPNSNNPLDYKNFRLILEYDKENKFSFPRRRVVGIRSDNTQIIGDYSFSADSQILVDEVKFKIDQFLDSNLDNSISVITLYPPVGRKGLYDNEYYTTNNQTYIWSDRSQKWEPVTITFTTPFYPVGREGFYNGESINVNGNTYFWNSSTKTWSVKI
jgi:hypothetical protein